MLNLKSRILLRDLFLLYWQCHYCGLISVDRYSARIHKKTHIGQHWYKCMLCEYKVNDLELMSNHIETHGAAEVNVMELPIVSRDVPTQKVKGRRLDLFCSICEDKFYCDAALLDHKMTHIGEQWYRCTRCDFMSPDVKQMIDHRLSHGHQDTEYCTHCPRVSQSRRNFS